MLTLLLQITSLSLLFHAAGVAATPPSAPAVTYDAQVVVNLAAFDLDALDRLSKEVGKSRNVTLEYSCVWSGIVVLKCSGLSVGERADVITYVRRLLSSAGIEQGVTFLHVHVEPSGPGKC